MAIHRQLVYDEQHPGKSSNELALSANDLSRYSRVLIDALIDTKIDEDRKILEAQLDHIKFLEMMMGKSKRLLKTAGNKSEHDANTEVLDGDDDKLENLRTNNRNLENPEKSEKNRQKVLQLQILPQGIDK